MVSVIIPTFDRPESLRRALRGVRAQTGTSWEVIVISGDSDGLSVARSFGDHRIRAYRNPGLSATDARNAALEVARGAVIALLDDDDWWEDPQHLERICQTLKRGEALVYRGGWLVQHADGTELERSAWTPATDAAALRADNPLLVSGVAYPAVMHDWLGPFDARMGDYWDWDWYLRVISEGVPLFEIPEPGVCASLHLGAPGRVATRLHDLAALAAKHDLRDLPLATRTTLPLERVSLFEPQLDPVAAD